MREFMNNFKKLNLNEQLCLIAIIIEEFEEGLEYTYNGIKRVFYPKDIGFNNTFEVSRVLYIMSNFIINEKSYNVSPKLRTLTKNEKIFDFLSFYEKSDFLDKLDILIYLCEFLSVSKELKKVNFIDEIRNGYRFIDLANDIKEYKKSL